MEDKKSNGFGILLILILIALCGYFIWMYFSSDDKTNDNTNDNKNSSEQKEDTLNEEEALKEIEEKYMIAINTYNIKDKFTLATEKTKIDDKEYYEITDYEDVMNNVFTSDGQIEFEDYHKEYIHKKDDKVYVSIEIIDNEISYSDNYKETTFEKKTIESDKITYKAISSYEGMDDDEEDFILVKKDDNWLVDEFHFPYKKTE